MSWLLGWETISDGVAQPGTSWGRSSTTYAVAAFGAGTGAVKAIDAAGPAVSSPSWAGRKAIVMFGGVFRSSAIRFASRWCPSGTYSAWTAVVGSVAGTTPVSFSA